MIEMPFGQSSESGSPKGALLKRFAMPRGLIVRHVRLVHQPGVGARSKLCGKPPVNTKTGLNSAPKHSDEKVARSGTLIVSVGKLTQLSSEQAALYRRVTPEGPFKRNTNRY